LKILIPEPSSVHVPTELIPFVPKRPIYSNSGHTYYPPGSPQWFSHLKKQHPNNIKSEKDKVRAIDNRNQQLKNEQYSKKEPHFTVRVLKNSNAGASLQMISVYIKHVTMIE
jgi:hypothetical protein